MDENFESIPESIQDQRLKLDKALVHISELKDPALFANNRKAIDCFYYCFTVLKIQEPHIINNSDYLVNSKLGDVLVESCNYFSNNDTESEVFRYVLEIILLTTSNQFKNEMHRNFTTSLITKNLLKSLIPFISQDKYPHVVIKVTKIIEQLTENPKVEKTSWKESKIELLLLNHSLKNELFLAMVEHIFQNINQKPLEEIIEGLINKSKELKDLKDLIDDPSIYVDLIYMRKAIRSNQENVYIFLKHDCEPLFCNILRKIFEMRHEIDFVGATYENDFPNKNADLNERRISVMSYVLFTMNWLTAISVQLNISFGTVRIIKILLDFLDDDYFIDQQLKFINEKKPLVANLVRNLSALSKYSVENRKDWTDLNTIEILVNLSLKFIKIDKTIVEYSYNCIGYLADDNQIENLQELKCYIKAQLGYLKIFADTLKKNGFMNKKNVEYLDYACKKVCKSVSCYLILPDVSCTLSNLLEKLSRFSVNLNTKKVIYAEKESIKICLYNGYELDRIYCLKLIAQLCFSQEVADDLLKDTEFHKYISNLASGKDCTKEKRVAEAILWNISHNCSNCPKPDEIRYELSKDPNNQNQSNKYDLMISYSWSSQKFCIRLKDELEKNGYSVWIDVNEMTGSTLESMSSAVENSNCILMCVCEKYKLSENCQLEAKYAAKLKKPIIPIIVQRGSEKIDGWLGMLISDKIYIDFTKHEFDSSFKNLNKEIEKNLLIKPNREKQPNNTEKRNSKTYSSKELWTQEQVKNWMQEHKFHDLLIKTYSDIDGHTLKEFLNIKTENPSFFHQKIMDDTNNELKLHDLAFFTSRLRLLFD